MSNGNHVFGDQCPAIVPADLCAPSCLVFETCTQKIGEVRLPASNVLVATFFDLLEELVEEATTGLDDGEVARLVLAIINQLLARPDGVLEFDACPVGTPRLEGRLLRDKIINCGDVDACVTVRLPRGFTTTTIRIPNPGGTPNPIVLNPVTIPANTVGSTVVTLTIQAETEAPGVRPDDCIFERVVDTEGATTCLVRSTVPDPTPIREDGGGLLTIPLLIVKASFIVLQKVVRVLQPELPSCPPTSPCPPTHTSPCPPKKSHMTQHSPMAVSSTCCTKPKGNIVW